MGSRLRVQQKWKGPLEQGWTFLLYGASPFWETSLSHSEDSFSPRPSGVCHRKGDWAKQQLCEEPYFPCSKVSSHPLDKSTELLPNLGHQSSGLGHGPQSLGVAQVRSQSCRAPDRHHSSLWTVFPVA